MLRWLLIFLTLAMTAMVGCGSTPVRQPTAERALPSAEPRGSSEGPSRDRQPLEARVDRKKPRKKLRTLRSNKQVAERCERILPAAREVAEAHGVDLGLLMAIARLESRYDPSARNRRSGAAGLMQVMPSTGRHFKCGNLYDMESNLVCGARILKRYLAYFDGDTIYGVAAYHAGIVAPKRARKANKLPRNFHYVERVLQVRSRFSRSGCH